MIQSSVAGTRCKNRTAVTLLWIVGEVFRWARAPIHLFSRKMNWFARHSTNENRHYIGTRVPLANPADRDFIHVVNASTRTVVTVLSTTRWSILQMQFPECLGWKRPFFSFSRFPAHARHGSENYTVSKLLSIRPSESGVTPNPRCQHHGAEPEHPATPQQVPSDQYTRQFRAPSEATVTKILRDCQTPGRELVQKFVIGVPSCPTLVRRDTGGCSLSKPPH